MTTQSQASRLGHLAVLLFSIGIGAPGMAADPDHRTVASVGVIFASAASDPRQQAATTRSIAITSLEAVRYARVQGTWSLACDTVIPPRITLKGRFSVRPVSGHPG